jgi:hypothetical protein
MVHAIAGYIQVWEDRDWLNEGQRGFRPGYPCDSQIITVCQDISDSLDEAARLDAIIIDFSKAFDLVLHDRLLKTTLSVLISTVVVLYCFVMCVCVCVCVWCVCVCVWCVCVGFVMCVFVSVL